nr:MAG TPA: hypothetical protein [Caudoviricetes sp.]
MKSKTSGSNGFLKTRILENVFVFFLEHLSWAPSISCCPY